VLGPIEPFIPEPIRKENDAGRATMVARFYNRGHGPVLLVGTFRTL
jgi:hypothetical protein